MCWPSLYNFVIAKPNNLFYLRNCTYWKPIKTGTPRGVPLFFIRASSANTTDITSPDKKGADLTWHLRQDKSASLVRLQLVKHQPLARLSKASLIQGTKHAKTISHPNSIAQSILSSFSILYRYILNRRLNRQLQRRIIASSRYLSFGLTGALG